MANHIKIETHKSSLACCHDVTSGEYWIGGENADAKDRAMNALMPIDDFVNEHVKGDPTDPSRIREVADACFFGTRPASVPNDADEKATFRAVWNFVSANKCKMMSLGAIAFHVTCPVAGCVDFILREDDGLHVCEWCSEPSVKTLFRLSALRLLLELSKQYEQQFGDCYALIATKDGVEKRKMPDQRLQAAVGMFQVADTAWFRKNDTRKPI